MKIVNVDSWQFSQEARAIYSEIGHYSEFNTLSRHEFLNVTKHCDILILRLSQVLDKEFFSCAKSLKFVICNVTGLDHIDLKEASKLGVTIVSLKGHFEFLRNIHATAELTWGLIIASVRNICLSNLDVKVGNWNRNEFFGSELFGKKIGILGYGRIGEKIARYAEAFGMCCHAYDPSPLSHNNSVQYFDSMKSFLASDLDILSIHVNYSVDTHHLIDRDALSLLKSGIVIVNSSRGGVIDEAALIERIKLGYIGKFATDVLEGETTPSFLNTSCLAKLARQDSRILITPHIGGVTHDSWAKTEIYCATQLVNILKKNAH